MKPSLVSIIRANRKWVSSGSTIETSRVGKKKKKKILFSFIIDWCTEIFSFLSSHFAVDEIFFEISATV